MIYTVFVQGDLVCCMTATDFFEALQSFQKDWLCTEVLEEDIDDINASFGGIGIANSEEAA
jgi:hypothetical protein